MNKLAVSIGIALLIVGLCLITTGSALEPVIARGFNLTGNYSQGYDNFQYESDTELDEHWTVVRDGSHAIVEVVENKPPGYTYNKAVRLMVTREVWGPQAASIKNKNASASNYWSFNMLSYDYPGRIWIYLYDYDDILITSFTADNYVGYYDADIGLWEFVRVSETGDIYFYVEGVNMKAGGGAIANSAKEFGYIKIRSRKGEGYTDAGADVYVDDFNNYDLTYGGVVGLGSDGYDYILHEDDQETISVSYILHHYPDSMYGDHIYKLRVRNRYTGEIVSSETITADHGNRNFLRSSLFHYNYDTYEFYTTKDDSHVSYEYLKYIPPGTEGSNIAFEDDVIVIGEQAQINYDIVGFDSNSFDYKIRVSQYIAGSDIIRTFDLNSSSGSVYWDTTDMTDGYYAAFLRMQSKTAPDKDYGIGYTSTQLVEMIKISGFAYDMVTGAALSGVSVKYTQGATEFTDTTDGTGFYEVVDLSSGTSTVVNATKASYSHEGWIFSPTSGFHTADIYMYPTDMAPYPRVGGQVLSNPFHQAIPNATVSIFNGSWSDTNTTTQTGFYEFDGADGIYSTLEYTLNASASGYFTSSNTNVTVLAAELTPLWFALDPSYTLTLRVRDRGSGGYLNVFNATINNETHSTTSGLLEISGLVYTIYELKTQAPGHYYDVQFILMYGDRDMVIDLTTIPTAYQAGVGLYLPPHNVQFTVQDIFFRKKEDVTVTAEYVDSAISWDTLIAMHGYNEDTFSANESMSGVTDSNGRIVFSMIPAARYEMTFKNDALGIDKVWSVYPHDDKYTIYVDSGLFGGVDNWFGDQPTMIGDEVIITFSTNQISETKCYLNITYNDTLLDTNSVYFFVNYSNNTVLNSKTKTLDYYEYSYLLSNISGNTFVYGVTADHGEYGELREAKVVYFYKRLVVIDGWTETYYLVAGLAFSFLIGIVFSGHSVKNGAVVFPIFCWIFWYMGWLHYTGIEIILGIIMAIGVGYYVTAKGREEGIT